jgi:ABC-2 type transport system ATP-binding protein
VTVSTREVAAAADEIRRTFELEPIVDGGSLRVEVPDGAGFVPRLVRELTVPLSAVTLSRPSLDDVFLKLTGKAIRDEAAGGMDQMRAMMSMWNRSGGRR